MRITVTSSKAFILNSLEEQTVALLRQGKQGISPTIEFGLAELVRQEMRSLARQGMAGCGEEELLEQSIRQACDALQARVWARDMRFDFAPYIPGLQNSLQFPAKEIAELSRTHLDAVQHGRVPQLSRVNGSAAIPYEIFEVGNWRISYGLMARPLVDQFDLELVQDSNYYKLQGEWFPFVLNRKEMEFVLNEDGTVFVTIVKFSSDYALTALGRLFRVCEQVFREASKS